MHLEMYVNAYGGEYLLYSAQRENTLILRIPTRHPAAIENGFTLTVSR